MVQRKITVALPIKLLDAAILSYQLLYTCLFKIRGCIKCFTQNREYIQQDSLVDIGPKWAQGQSGVYQKFCCILLLPTSGGILQLVYCTGATPYGSPS